MQSLIGAKPEHQLQHRGIHGETLRVRNSIDQPGRGHHLEAFIDADEELRRKDRALDRAELNALDLPRIEPNWLAG